MKFFGEFSIAILKTFMDVCLKLHITKLNYSDFIFLLGLFSWVGGGQNEIYKNWVTTNSNDWFLILHTAYNKTQKHCPLLAKENLYLIMCIKIKQLCIKTLDLRAIWQKALTMKNSKSMSVSLIINIIIFMNIQSYRFSPTDQN